MVHSFVGKIQKGISHFVHKKHGLSEELVAEEVREGYFAVVAVKDGELKRFMIGLEYLSHPEFLGLLDQAREEYGFIHKGAIFIPCQPQQLQTILDGQRCALGQRALD